MKPVRINGAILRTAVALALLAAAGVVRSAAPAGDSG